jgi:hypothetical protein
MRFVRIVPALLVILGSLALLSGCEMPAATTGGYPVFPHLYLCGAHHDLPAGLPRV